MVSINCIPGSISGTKHGAELLLCMQLQSGKGGSKVILVDIMFRIGGGGVFRKLKCEFAKQICNGRTRTKISS